MKTPIPVPTINANDEVVLVVRWHTADGAEAKAGDALVDVETTKAVTTIHTEHAGWVRRRCREGDEIAVGADLAWVFSTQEELAAAQAEPATQSIVRSVEQPTPSAQALVPASAPAAEGPAGRAAAGAADSGSGVVRAAGASPASSTITRLSPQAEKLATTLGLDRDALARNNLGLVTSSVLRAMAGPAGGPAGAPASPDPATAGLRRERLPLGKRAEIDALRQGVGEHLTSSLSVYLDSAGVRAFATEAGHGLLPLVLAELGPLLRENPKFTAFVDGDCLAFHDAVHLGVAVDLGDGPKVVTIRDADRLDAAAIGEALAQRTLDYMERTLGPDAVQGSTFTVTDLTGLNILHFQPLINGRQSAILGLGADANQPGHPMTLTMVFDHRVLTGREVGTLLHGLRSRILARGAQPQVRLHTAPPTQAQADISPLACDFCLTDLTSYYREFGPAPSAVMLRYVRKDGSSGLVCHRCQGGFL